MDRIKKVMIGTPCYDGRIEVWYANSMLETVKLGRNFGIDVFPIYLSYDALIQRARNDLLSLMLEFSFDDIVFIDSDIEWKPDDFFKLLNHQVDVVGGTYPKKGDDEQYVIKLLDSNKTKDPETGLLAVDGLGTGFLRLSKTAVEALWNSSQSYEEKNSGNNKLKKWIFEVAIINGDLVSEDILLCSKLTSLGIPVYLDTSITCNHIGTKKYSGNFDQWFSKVNKINTSYGSNIKSLYS